LTTLAGHANPEVRVQAARGLGAFPHPATIAVLTKLVRDEAWAVRAQVVRSLGMITDRATLPLVRNALRDPEWWVRIRAGLALTRFGSIGRDALLQDEHGPDQGARDMARLVLGLSAQALAEYAM